MTSCQEPEARHNGSIYTLAVGRHCESQLRLSSSQERIVTIFQPTKAAAPCRADLRQELPFQSALRWSPSLEEEMEVVLRKISGCGRGSQGELGRTSSPTPSLGPHSTPGAAPTALLSLNPHFPSGLQPIPDSHTAVQEAFQAPLSAQP